jgi:hypothetical protein
MTLTKPPETINFTPHRGELEPVTETIKSEVNLYENHLELIYNYKFTRYSTKEEAHTLLALTVTKANLSLGITTRYLDDDPDKRESPVVEIYVNGSYVETICVETQKEAYKIYEKIKTWMLNE